MVYLLALLATILAIELFIRIPVISLANSILKIAKKAQVTIFSKSISDHWKEKVLLKYAEQIAILTFKILVLVGGILFLVFILSMILDIIFIPKQSTFEFLITLQGILLSIIAGFIYIVFRKSYVSK